MAQRSRAVMVIVIYKKKIGEIIIIKKALSPIEGSSLAWGRNSPLLGDRTSGGKSDW